MLYNQRRIVSITITLTWVKISTKAEQARVAIDTDGWGGGVSKRAHQFLLRLLGHCNNLSIPKQVLMQNCKVIVVAVVVVIVVVTGSCCYCCQFLQFRKIIDIYIQLINLNISKETNITASNKPGKN